MNPEENENQIILITQVIIVNVIIRGIILYCLYSNIQL